ncbi:MAG: hypothetical protein J6F30_16155 [Cellulosilyticum sp.]|nr:hypothetical protein [Cellulosilyticum sp.]
MKYKKGIICFIVGLLLILGIGYFYPLREKKQLSFSVSFNIRKLTDAEYREVGTNGLINPQQDDFRKGELIVEIKHTNAIYDRCLDIPSIKEIKMALNKKEEDRYWWATTTVQDNVHEDKAFYHYEFVFYSKGLDEGEIRDLFKELKVSGRWIDSYSKEHEEVFRLNDVICFSERSSGEKAHLE